MLTRIKSKARRKIQEFKEHLFWIPLVNHKDLDVRKLSCSLKFVKEDKNWQGKEINCFNKIIALRSKYAKSSESVQVIDYGAGNPNANRSIEEMETGVEKQMQVSEIYNLTSSPDRLGKLIFKLIREFKPEKCLELGTSLGVSGMYQISGLKLNEKGQLITIEGAPEVAKIADLTLSHIKSDGYSIKVGRFKDVMEECLKIEGNFDFVFIDGHHDRKATKEYFEMIYPSLSNKAVIIFDDIHWSTGMSEVWREINEDKRIKHSFELIQWGICLIDKDVAFKKNYCIKVPL